MSALSKPLMTPEEYLERERRAEFKSEFYRGEMFAMAGASRQHVIARDNLAGELHALLKGKQCRAFSIDMRVKISATGLYTYPDISIVCGLAEFEDQVLDTLLNPQVIFEVLSPSTAEYDRGPKAVHYRKIPTLQEYVLVSQDEPRVERFVRQPDGQWLLREFAGLDAVFELATVPAKVLLAEIYRDVEFPPVKLR